MLDLVSKSKNWNKVINAGPKNEYNLPGLSEFSHSGAMVATWRKILRPRPLSLSRWQRRKDVHPRPTAHAGISEVSMFLQTSRVFTVKSLTRWL